MARTDKVSIATPRMEILETAVTESDNDNDYSRTPLIRPPSESHLCGRIRGMVVREGFYY